VVVDEINGRIDIAPLIGVENPLDITEKISKLRQRLDLAIFLENDVNAAAIGHLVFDEEFEASRLKQVGWKAGLI